MRIPVPRALWIVFEQWHAWRVSRRMLALYKAVRKERPHFCGPALYERVVARRGGSDGRTPAAIVRCAAESFTTWPVARHLRFRDVVQFLAFDEFVASHRGCIGTQSGFRRVINLVIPEAL